MLLESNCQSVALPFRLNYLAITIITRKLVPLLTFSVCFLLYLRISTIPTKVVEICTKFAFKVFPDVGDDTDELADVVSVGDCEMALLEVGGLI
jgi:hypothetical protein